MESTTVQKAKTKKIVRLFPIQAVQLVVRVCFLMPILVHFLISRIAGLGGMFLAVQLGVKIDGDSNEVIV